MKGSTVETCEVSELVECQICGDETTEHDSNLVDDPSRLPYHVRRNTNGYGPYCDECLTECSNCTGYTVTDDVMYDPNGREPFCHDCWFDNWAFCDDCGDTMTHETSHYDDRLGYTVCAECYSPDGGVACRPVHTCPLCRTNNVHFHLLSEQYLCDCVAGKQPAAYVVLAYDLSPEFSTLTNVA
jgi:hypothetical protein